ncbi:MAG: PKD domain-containing protein, partial [Nanoarchaeota archaeon]|nr:PKD domain-containing protein [Nanoarchaeota archaeon]
MLINKHQKIFALILLIASLILFNISFVNAASLPSVETLSASYVSGNAAALNGRVTNNGGGTINERRFDWGTTSSCSDGWTNSTGVAGNYFSYYLTGLTPGRTYYFRAWAHNSAGWSHGNVLSFTTTSLCTNECSSSGTTRCSGNYKQICGNYDADSCLEWCETPDCNSGYHGDDCGSSYCDSFGSNYCKSGNVYHSRTCYNKGCSSNTCFNNSYTDEQLVQTCSNGCSNGVCTVNQIPTCSLSSSPRSGNAPLTVTFNLGASDSDGSIGAWVLDVTGDGNADYSGTGNPPSTKTYTYNNPGSYSVAFIVSDNKGANSNPCLDTINVGSNDPPTASLSASPLIGDAPLTVGFSLNASDSDGYIANWILDYGDGTSDSGNGNPPSTKFHTYANNGTYSAILSVFDNGNVNVFSMKTITVNAKNQIPTCSLSSSPRSGKAPLFVTFSLSGNDPDGSIAAWVLDVTGDGNADYSGNGNPPATKTYNYTNSGSYSVAFMVKDNKGKFSNACLDTINVGSINQPPISSLSADPKTGNAPLNVTFSLGASDSDGSITIWALVTGDGTNYSGNGNPPATKIHTYTNPGTYTAILGISDDDNATNFAMDTIVVNQPLPQATLTLYVHEGSVNGQIIPGARVNGTDASGKYFDVVTDSNGYVTITGSVGTWSFTASMSGYKIVSWSQTINTTCRRDAYIQKEASPISIVITSPLKINPVKSEYDTSDILSAEFKIKNNGASPVTLDVLTVGGRDPDNVVIDFYWQRNITIAPYSNYSYSGNIYSLLSKQGNYHFFCTYRTQEGNWNTNIDLGTGLNVNDREKDIRVVPKYYLTSVPLIDRGGIIIPNGTFPAGEGKMIPIYVPDVINDSNIIRDVDGWITVKNIEKAKFNWDPLKFFLGLFTVGSINSDSPIKSPTGEAVANSFVTLITSGIDASSVAKYKITIQQKGSEQNFRAIIQQGVYPSPVKDLAGAGEQIIINPFDNIYFSNMIAEVFYLEPCSFPYNYWLTASVDSLHENDEYLYYISISNDNRIVSTPKIYAGDKIEVKKISDFNPFNKEVVLELKGDSYTSFFSRPVNNETFKSIKKELSQIDLTLNSTIKIQEHSSGELRVYDSNGNVTGIVNGVIKEEIPFSIYDNESKTVFLSDPSSVYHYNIVGTTAGIYGLTITFTGKESTDKFDAFDIPISNNTVYQYTVDWGVISQGGEGVTLEIDSNGDSLFEKIITEDKELTQAEFIKKTTIPILHCQELQNMKNDLTASYMLQNDINCYETKTWNNGKGFEPIGNLSNKFTGSFN